jgi:hypothetical protein
MRIVAVVAVVAALLFSCPVTAQTMYKCRTATGASAYQQTPCDRADQTVDSRYIAKEQDSAPAPHEGFAASSRQDRVAGRPASRGAHSEFGAGDAYAPPPVYLYSCNDEKRTWTQAKPCTAMVKYYEASDQPTRWDRHGTPIYAPSIEKFRPAEQRVLTRTGLCTGSQSSGSKGIDSYERNKLKSLGQC